jgi:hypothetical protein
VLHPTEARCGIGRVRAVIHPMIDLNELDAAAWARRVFIETDSGREGVRAFYGRERGVPHPVTGRFDIPTCGNWECLSPEHQSWIGSPPRRGSSSRSRQSSEEARA